VNDFYSSLRYKTLTPKRPRAAPSHRPQILMLAKPFQVKQLAAKIGEMIASG
jgi:hypothetical protein